MHVEFLQVDGGKMSKSLNNIYRLADLEERGYSAEDYRFFYFLAHYSKQQNFTFEALDMAKNTLKTIKNLVEEHKSGNFEIFTQKYEDEFLESINDDLNMPRAIACVQKMLKEDRSKNVYQTFLKFNQVLGINLEQEEISQEVKTLAEERWQAKLSKNFKLADELRNKIDNLGYLIKDNKDGYQILKK